MATAAVELVESSKKAAAYKAVEDHFSTDFTHVGIGSGSTVVYVVEAIRDAIAASGKRSPIVFVPTGYQSRQLIIKAGMIPIAFDDLPEDQILDVAFDGADEVDDDFNCVKGGGACLYQEKLVAMRAKKFIVVADFRKDAERLLTTWTYVPVEVEPLALKSVLRALRALGSPNPELRLLPPTREGPLKENPLQTDQGLYIVKAPFPQLLISKDGASTANTEAQTADGQTGRVWSVSALAEAIKAITGVLDVGLFYGLNGPQALKLGNGLGGQKPIACYFGMSDGTVKVKKAPEA